MSTEKNEKILIVEDYTPIVFILKYQLKKLGFKSISHVKTHTEAWTAFTESDYDWVISDWGDVESFNIKNLYNEIGKLRGPRFERFIAILDDNEFQKEEIKNIGIRLSLQKPFSASELGNLLKKHMFGEQVG